MTKDEALKKIYQLLLTEPHAPTVCEKLEAIVREALAQPAQEPPSEWEGIKAILDEYGLQAIDFVADFKAALAQPVQPVQPVQEPVACARCKNLEEQAYDLLGKLKVANLKWSVAHPWVGLTDKEIVQVLGNVREKLDGNVFGSFARAIEHALKEKNT